MTFGKITAAGVWRVSKSLIPLIFGAITFFIFMYTSQSDGDYSSKNLVLVSSAAFNGANLVYATLLASLATTFAGTVQYRRDLIEMKELARGTQGIFKINVASGVLFSGLVISTIWFFAPFVFRATVSHADICNNTGLDQFLHKHDYIVLILFSTFLVADVLTWQAMLAVRDETKSTNKEKSDASAFSAEFSKLQFLLIDIPVIIGAGLILFITSYAYAYSDWDNNILKIDPSVAEYLKSNKSINLLRCLGDGLSLQQFQEGVTKIFVTGIAMGYLAAHIIMSQVIFFFLNVVHDRRIERIEAEGEAEISEILA